MYTLCHNHTLVPKLSATNTKIKKKKKKKQNWTGASDKLLACMYI